MERFGSPQPMAQTRGWSTSAPRNTEDREEPILAGDLDKKGAMFGSWVTRYYCLMKTGDSLKLSYKMKPTDTNVKGEWLLRNFSAHVDDSDASGMRFIIETPDKMVVFRAKSQVDCNQWVQRLSVEAKTLISGHDGRLRKSNECKICKSELSPESTYSCETCRMFMCGSQNCSTTDISMSPVCMECYSKSAGKGDVLMLTIVEGKDLAAFDANGFSDPYVVVKFDGVEHRTKIRYKTLKPVWFHQVNLQLQVHSRMLELFVYDHDTFGSDECMGVVRIPIAHLESGHVYDSWFALRPRNRNAREKAAGSIRLRMLKQSSQGIDSLETAHARLHNVLTRLQAGGIIQWFQDLFSFQDPVTAVWVYILYCLMCIKFPADYRTIAETVESLEMKRLDWVAESRKSPGFGLSDEPMPITASTISPAIEALAPAGALEYLQPEDHAFAHATSAATSSPTQASRPPPLTSIPSSRHLISSPSSLVASLSTVGMSTPSRSAPVPAPLVSSRSARDLRGAAGSAESSLDAPDLLRDSSIDARCSDPGVALEYAAVDEQRKRLFHNPDDDKLIDVFGADKDEQKKNHSESAASDLKRRKGREDLEAAAEEQSTAEMARMRAEAKAKEEVERRMYAAQGMSRMPFVWPAEKRREVSAITDVLEGIADLLFKPAHGGAGGKGGKSHAAEHTLALRTGIVWLVAALLVPTRILLLVLGTIRFTAELRHKQWRDAYRVSDARVGPKSSKRSNLCVDAEAARVRGLSGSTSLSESLAEPATITIMND